VGQITAHSNLHSSFSLSFFPLCVRGGFDEKILHLAVQYSNYVCFHCFHAFACYHYRILSLRGGLAEGELLKLLE
jgi:hypothetical protein